MSNELHAHYLSSFTLYAVIRNRAGQVWEPSGQAFEAWGTGGNDADTYDIAMTDKSGSLYVGDFDTNVSAGYYKMQYFLRQGASPADGDSLLGYEWGYWDGTSWTGMVNSGLGVGDYDVTLTIRTTGGTPLAGVSVWVSTQNDRDTASAGTLQTNGSGEVTFRLEYTTYYVFCNLSGYSFNDTNFTAASGSVAFTLDIGSAVSGSGGAASDYSESFLTRGISLVRQYSDEPSTNKKWTDANIIECMESVYGAMLAEIRANSRTPVVARHEITISGSLTVYPLPHHVSSIWAIYDEDSNGGRVFYHAQSPHNPLGRFLWIEGSELHVQTADMLNAGEVITVEYVPSGMARLHNGTCSVNSDGDEVTLASTPNAGTLDTHVSAYAGSVVRILKVTGTSPTGNMLQERTIVSYDNSTRVATLDAALSPVPVIGSGGSIFYEIAPSMHKGLDDVIAVYTAWRIMMVEGNYKRASGLKGIWHPMMRNMRLTAYYSSIPDASQLYVDNHDVQRWRNP